MPRPISWYQRRLALKGIKSIVISTEIINKKDGLEMADLRNKPISVNPDDDLIIDAPVDIWDSVLPLGLWDAVIPELPIAERSKKGLLQLKVPLVLSVNGGNRKASIYFQLEGNGLKWTRENFDELGIDYSHDGISALRIKGLKQFVNLKCKALVAENKYNGTVTNRIKKLFNKDYVTET